MWLVQGMTPSSHVWEILLPMALFGVGNAYVWAPNSATATRNLPLADAGAGVYNAPRELGAVLGSAGIAVLIDARLLAHDLPTGGTGEGRVTQLPAAVRVPFADSMAQSLYLPAAVFLIGLVAVLFFERPGHAGFGTTTVPTSTPVPVPNTAD